MTNGIPTKTSSNKLFEAADFNNKHFTVRRPSMVRQACSATGFERVLVATDGSRFSKAAVQEAITIARACSGKLFVLLVSEMSDEPDFWDVTSAKDLEQEMKKHLDSVKAKAAREGVACEVLLHRGGVPYKVIVAESAKRRIGTIVMGSHGRTGLSRLLMGSVVSRVIGHAPCRVLVVPAKVKH
jgi:nucleotide-binding universal stress UspA family protein